ncbi:MAG TPA: metallophosphoesterase family protein, partial [Polyangiales bacterium]|nr:metallophosphoesterase family protein [Polyangiales bacterium]
PTPPFVQTRIGVIGDIHTEAGILAWAIDQLREQRVQRIFATGDIADGPQHGEGVIESCRLLRQFDVLTVLGNHDRWMLDNERRDFPDATFVDELNEPTRAYLQSLPVSLDIMTPSGLMVLGHGLGDDDMAGLYPHDHGPALSDNVVLQTLLRGSHYQLVLSGHTHRRMVRKLDGVTFINAGSIKSNREPCCLILDFVERIAKFIDYAADGGAVDGPVFEL